jgi:hypothetical protein
MIDLFAILCRIGREPDPIDPIEPDTDLVEYLSEQVCTIPVCGFVLRRVFIGV